MNNPSIKITLCLFFPLVFVVVPQDPVQNGVNQTTQGTPDADKATKRKRPGNKAGDDSDEEEEEAAAPVHDIYRSRQQKRVR